MGGCASRPKESDFLADSPPAEAPASPKAAEPEAAAHQEKTDGGDEKKSEEPLVDLSEPKQEAQDSSSAKSAADENKKPDKKSEAKAEGSKQDQ